jgi:hypothetical protein
MRSKELSGVRMGVFCGVNEAISFELLRLQQGWSK